MICYKKSYPFALSLLIGSVVYLNAADLIVPTDYATIQEAVDAAQAGDRILLTAGQVFNSGQIIIASTNLTFDKTGPGADPVITIAPNNRLFSIAYDAIVSINNLVIQGGNRASDTGGAIFSEGQLTISHCTLNNNNAQSGGAIAIQDSVFIASNCTFNNNSASAEGGAIHNTGATSTISYCTFLDNASHDGGAIFTTKTTATITCCRFADNTVTGSGSAICNDPNSDYINAINNWWGDNDNPSALLFGQINFDPWTTVSMNANSALIGTNGTSTIKAIFTPCIPDGTPVAFSTTSGTMTPVLALTADGVAESVLKVGFTWPPLTVNAVVGPEDEAFPLNLTLTHTNNAQQSLNQFPLVAELANVVTWQPIPPSIFPDVVSYWIFLAPSMLNPIAIINATQPLCYIDHNIIPCTEYTYYIYAINSKGEESKPAIVKVNKS